jgi:SAM-dependent methyltransferase
MLSCCPLCSGDDIATCFVRDRVPVFQNVGYETPQEAAGAAFGRLSITHCNDCGFVFNAAFDPGLAVYSPRYENDQTMSSAFCDYLDQIAARVLGSLDPQGSPIVLEVGCGQGHFLKRLAGLPAARFNRFLGFDPAWRGGETGGALEIRPRIFDAAATREIGGTVGSVVSRHVIEHVSDPVGFLRAIRAAAPPAHGIKLMIETPCLEWIVRNDVVYDFFYEHCSYFTRDTLAFALRRAGYRVDKVEPVFNGQYLWAEAEPLRRAGPVDRPRPIGLAERIARLGRLGAQRLAELRAELAAYRSEGRVALWGAGAKGATLAALTDPEATLIDCLIDINPRKQGAYLAGTAHPVVAPGQAAARGVHTVLLLNPNYRAEVEGMIRDQALPFVLLDAQ